jgi:hypothetical protein
MVLVLCHAGVSSRQPFVALDDGAGSFEHRLPAWSAGQSCHLPGEIQRCETQNHAGGGGMPMSLVTAVSAAGIVHRHRIGHPAQALSEP